MAMAISSCRLLAGAICSSYNLAWQLFLFQFSIPGFLHSVTSLMPSKTGLFHCRHSVANNHSFFIPSFSQCQHRTGTVSFPLSSITKDSNYHISRNFQRNFTYFIGMNIICSEYWRSLVVFFSCMNI